MRAVFEDYPHSVPDHVEHLLREFQVVDVAVKVVAAANRRHALLYRPAEGQ